MDPRGKFGDKNMSNDWIIWLGTICFRAVFWSSIFIVISSIFMLSLKSFDDGILVFEILSLANASLSIAYVALRCLTNRLPEERAPKGAGCVQMLRRLALQPAITLCVPWLIIDGINLTFLAKSRSLLVPKPDAARDWQTFALCIGLLITVFLEVLALLISCIFFIAYELSTSSLTPTLFGPLNPNNNKKNNPFPTHDKKSSISTHATTTTTMIAPSTLSFPSLETGPHWTGLHYIPPSPALSGLGIYTSPLPPLPLLSPLLSPPPRPDSAWRAVHPPPHAFQHAHAIPTVRRLAPSSPAPSLRGVRSCASVRSASASSAGVVQCSGSGCGYGNGDVRRPPPPPPPSRSVSSSSVSSGSSSLPGSPLRTMTSVSELEVREVDGERKSDEGKVEGKMRGMREGASTWELGVLDLKGVEVAVKEVHPAIREELVDADARRNGCKSVDIPIIPEVVRVGAIAWPVEWEIGVAIGGDCRSDASITGPNGTERKYDGEKPTSGRIKSEECSPESPDMEIPSLQISKKRSTGIGDEGRGRNETKKLNSLGTLRRFALERSRNERPEMNFLYDEKLS